MESMKQMRQGFVMRWFTVVLTTVFAAAGSVRATQAGAQDASKNKPVASLGTLLHHVQDELAEGKYDTALAEISQLTARAPNESVLWLTEGEVQLAIAHRAWNAARVAHKPPNDPSVTDKSAAAVLSFKKAIDLCATAKRPDPVTVAVAYRHMGEALVMSGDMKGAADAYDGAAKAEPQGALQVYVGESLTIYESLNIKMKAGEIDDSAAAAAAAAADKAIAAYPKEVGDIAPAYFVKGWVLSRKATLDPKTNRITAPPGCMEAFQKYLELDPVGEYADQVKDISRAIGLTVKLTDKSGKKSWIIERYK